MPLPGDDLRYLLPARLRDDPRLVLWGEAITARRFLRGVKRRAEALAGTATADRRLPLAERIKTRIEHQADTRSAGSAVWLLRLTRGRIVRLWHRQVLVLTTRGRKSGKKRTVPLQFFPDGEDMLVVAANSGLRSPPGWYLNLRADPRAKVEVAGRTLDVRAEELSADEAAAFWPRLLQVAPDYARYPGRTSRRIPLIRLVAHSVGGTLGQGAVPCRVHNGLAVYQFGTGEPVLVMPAPHRFERPGLRAADALLYGLGDLGRRVITFDPPGSGQSTRPARLGMAELHDCTDEALQVCGVDGPVDAVGHSMAGLTTLAYAIERPERVRRLVLVGTGSGGPAYMRAPGALWNRSHPHFPGLAALGTLHLLWRARGPERLMNNYIQRYSFHDRRLVEPRKVTLLDWVRPREGRTDWHGIAKRLDYSPRLKEIAVPTLILCGRHDPQFPTACSRELAAGIQGAELVWFDASGHYPYIEEPQAFWTAVAAFLGRTSDQSTPAETLRAREDPAEGR